MPYKNYADQKKAGDRIRREKLKKDPLWDMRNGLRSKFGMTVEQKDQMMISQDNRCAICSSQFKDRSYACVDHDHKTGKIRQLLCRGCNAGIGNLKENPMIIKAALLYVEKWIK